MDDLVDVMQSVVKESLEVEKMSRVVAEACKEQRLKKVII